MQITNTPAIAVAAQDQKSADLLALNVAYTPTIGGRRYDAQLSFSGGEYVATIPQLPNISASGGSLVLAETNLDAKLRLMA